MPTPPDVHVRYLTARDLAEILGLHEQTVLRMARAGRLPCRRFGHSVRFRLDDIEQWAAVAVAVNPTP